MGIEMPNAAGGLQEAMKFAPMELHHGDEGYIVFHYKVSKVRFDPTSKDAVEPLRRVHVLHTDEAAPIDAEYVEQSLAEYRDRIRKAKDEAVGTMSLGLGDGEGEEGDLNLVDDENQVSA